MFSNKSVSDSLFPSRVNTRKTSRFKRFLAFLGPAYLISIGYMDPGNWATDIAAGSQFGYQLLWVLLLSNVAAIFLQGLCVRLGIVYGRDLAQANRDSYPRWLNLCLYILAELSIIATDLAEVLGMAIGLHLLIGISIELGVVITILDTFLLFYLQRLGVRKMESFIIAMIVIILGAFLIQNLMINPDLQEVAQGFVPHIENSNALYLAIGIIGATIMPHNLYLHSALVQTRKIEKTTQGIRRAIRFNFIDSALALNLAFFVNGGILMLAAGLFYVNGMHEVTEIKDAYALLTPLLGSKLAPILFAVALIAAGQSSTITGTLAGQIVMEGYLGWRINPVARRLIARFFAVVPAFIIVHYWGEKYVDKLLIFSQVVLSLQLGFALIPLVHFVSDKSKMGEFVLPWYQKIIASIIIGALLYLNASMVISELSAIDYNIFGLILLLLSVGFLVFILGYLIVLALFNFRATAFSPKAVHSIKLEDIPKLNLPVGGLSYSQIAICLDFSDKDIRVLEAAVNHANPQSKFTLIHVVESATAKVFGKNSADYETREDKLILAAYADRLRELGFEVTEVLGFAARVVEIPRIIERMQADLLVIGAHRHTRKRKIIFGHTIDSIRNTLNIPILIVNN